MAAMKKNTKMILDYLKEHNGEDLTSADLEVILGLPKKSIDGSFTSFQRKGWGVREEGTRKMEDGTDKTVKFLRLTNEGLGVNPEVEE